MSTTRAMTPAEAMAAAGDERPETSPNGTMTAIGRVYPYRSAKGPLVGFGGELPGNASVLIKPGEARHAAAVLAAYADAAEPEHPVMLGRPDIPEGASWSPWRDCPLTAAVDGGKVRQMWRDGPSLSMTPAQARQHAAALVVLADRAEAEPDPAEVGALTDVLRETYQRDNHAAFPDHARAILLAGWKREKAS